MLQLLLIPVLDFGMFRRWMQKMSLNFMKLSYCCCWNDNCQIDFGKWHKWHKRKIKIKQIWPFSPYLLILSFPNFESLIFFTHPKIQNLILYPNFKIWASMDTSKNWVSISMLKSKTWLWWLHTYQFKCDKEFLRNSHDHVMQRNDGQENYSWLSFLHTLRGQPCSLGCFPSYFQK